MIPRQLAPTYAWPTNEQAWQTLLQGEPGIAVVVGSNSGPGTAYSPALAARIASVKAQGWLALGYVSLDYLGLPEGPRHDAGQARRTLIDITADITAYREWYDDIDGIFGDELPGPHTGVLVAARAIEHMAHDVGPWCVLNPGVAVDPVWFRVLGGQTLVVTFEGTARDYPLEPRLVGDRCAHIVKEAPLTPDWPLGLGWAWSTPDGADGNAYDGVTNA